MTTAEITAAINKAKCCLGDIGCKLKFKLEGGLPHTYTLVQAMKIKLYIFSLENYLNLSCTTMLSETQLNYIRDQINRDCVSCTSSTSGSSTGDFSSTDFSDSDFNV